MEILVAIRLELGGMKGWLDREVVPLKQRKKDGGSKRG